MALHMTLRLVSVLLLVLTRTAFPNPMRRSASTNGECAMPSHHQLRARLLQLQQDTASFEPDFQTGGTGTVNSTCLTATVITSSTPINLRSTCPWEYVHEEDPERIPRVITKAVCRSCNNKCLSANSGQPIPDAHCEHINYSMKVLRRTGCTGGVYTYEVGTETFPVACSCSRPVAHRPPDM